VKTSLFLSRNESNSVSSFDVKSWEIITVLSDTLGSSGTLLVSHSGSIGLLTRLPSLSPLVVLLQFSAFLSCKQFMFLWSGAKPYSMFLTSFWLSWVEITPWMLLLSYKGRETEVLLQSVEETPSEDGIVRIIYVHPIEGYILSASVGKAIERYR
jgi:hypothetical protein